MLGDQKIRPTPPNLGFNGRRELDERMAHFTLPGKRDGKLGMFALGK